MCHLQDNVSRSAPRMQQPLSVLMVLAMDICERIVSSAFRMVFTPEIQFAYGLLLQPPVCVLTRVPSQRNNNA